MVLLEKKRPVTSSLRHLIVLKKKLFKGKPLKKKTFFLKNKAGRNNTGKITIYTKGGGHKKKYRSINFRNERISGVVESIEYDPFRTANIARIFSSFYKSHFYILAPEGLSRGHYINFSNTRLKSAKKFQIGNHYKLGELPLGSFLFNVPFFVNKKGKMARAAGTHAQLISRGVSHCSIRIASGEYRLLNKEIMVCFGSVSNSNLKLTNLGKAGRNRWLNRRPSVRGVAMNPIDHPHGGGEGKTSGGRPSVTPWGKPAHGKKTKKRKK